MTTQSRSFTPDLIAPARATPSPIAALAGFIAQIFLFARGRLRVWRMRFNDRVYLADLQGYQLSEMGMTFDQRDREANKWFWKT